MLRRSIIAFTLVALLCASSSAGSLGMFGGRIVRGDAPAGRENQTRGKWIYVKGRADAVRRVEISRATVEYDEAVPQASRSRVPADDLRDGAVVQVTAEQDTKSGEWVARSILVIRVAARRLVRSAAR